MKDFLILTVTLPAMLIAFAANGQDRFNITLLAKWDNPELRVVSKQKYNEVWGWYDSIKGREYAIMGSIDSTYFFDVTDPGNPVLCDAEAGRSHTSTWRDYKTHLHYCYAVADAGPSSLQIFDLSHLPDSVHKVYDSDSLLQRTHNIQIENGRLYCNSVTMKNGTRRAMQVLDLADPENPQLVSILIPPIGGGAPLFNLCHDVHVRNDTLYCSGENAGVFIYDYRTVNNPRLIASITNYPEQGYAHSAWTTEDNKFLVMADENLGLGLKVYDVSRLPQARFRSVFRSNPGAVPHNPFIKGVWVYVAYYEDGLWIFDISNPEKPVVAAFYDTYPQNNPGEYNGFYGCWGNYPFLPSGIILASDMLNGLHIFKADYGVGLQETTPHSFFKIYPNPAGAHTTIFSGENDECRYELSDLSGRILQSGTLHPNNENMLNLSQFATGVYLINIQHQGGIFTQKLIKR